VLLELAMPRLSSELRIARHSALRVGVLPAQTEDAAEQFDGGLRRERVDALEEIGKRASIGSTRAGGFVSKLASPKPNVN